MANSARRANTPGTADVRPADDGGQVRSSDFVQSLDRGLAVIRAFGPDRERLSLSEVARETGLTRAATRRFLLTLVKLGYVRSDGREFSLRPRVLELGYAYLSGLGMPEVAAPHLEELVAHVRESSSISVLDGHHIVYVARVPTKRIMTVAISVGTRFPAYATSMGRVLLAGLTEDELERYLAEAVLDPITARTVTEPARLREIVAEVGRQGYAIVDQELEEGLRAVAAPIRGAGDSVTAAINLSAHASRVSMAAMRSELLPALQATARHIEADLRSQGQG
ncbi:MAG TPA: IclR family transcriptional regulator C-terminal domain-containing protein [Streptosporangiaceae bacterium]|jgi:IclR family pca regulon transcriptional regulator|nr:IclR family transcriptional regulator C-terminal domain-containing protein [Streptosporangiaceae bacterium]